MGHVNASPPASDALTQDTHSFFKTMREQAAILAAAGRRAKSQLTLSSHDALSMLQAAAEACIHCPDLETRRQELLGAWKSVAELEVNQLEAELRDACLKRGWRIDGQWPKLIVERGIDVSIDTKKQIIVIGQIRVKDLSAKSVMNTLEKLVVDLLPKSFSVEQFLEDLASAHRACAKEPSDQVEIFKIYRALIIGSQPEKLWRDARASNFVSITIDQLRARLSTLLETSTLRTRGGQELRIFPALQPRDAIFVYQAAQSRFGYVGRIAFQRADGDQ